jgi:hypothetical protein
MAYKQGSNFIGSQVVLGCVWFGRALHMFFSCTPPGSTVCLGCSYKVASLCLWSLGLGDGAFRV